MKEQIKLEDFENNQFINDLVMYTGRLAPQFDGLVSALRSNEPVFVEDLQKLLECLHNEVVKRMGDDGTMEEDVLRLEDMVALVGGQL